MLPLAVAILSGVIGFNPTWAAEPRPAAVNDAVALARLDGFAQGLTLADRFSGVVLVAEGDKIVFERAYGAAEAVTGTPAKMLTQFNLASAGKMFTTVAVLQQIAAGRLHLDTRVGEVLKDYRNREFANKVTVRHLLTHTSGAGDIALFGVENANNRSRAVSHSTMLAMHDERAPAFEPGTKQEYGNFAYVVLGRMVEVLSGESYEDYIQQHIFAPAAMKRAGFVDCVQDAQDLAVGYATIDGVQTRNCATQPARGFAAGGHMATAEDVFAFVRALREGVLIPGPLFADATRTHREFMGLGFFATDYGPDVPARDFRWGHGGSADGACTDVRHYPETGETMIVLSNRDAPNCYAIAGFLHAQWRVEHTEPADHAR
jgi:D-alanyl-D-alanine carboxypeptidase